MKEAKFQSISWALLFFKRYCSTEGVWFEWDARIASYCFARLLKKVYRRSENGDRPSFGS